MDEETQKVLAEGDKITEFVKSQYWGVVKDRLEAKLDTLNSISALPDDIKDLQRELMVRKGVVSVIKEWMQEIEGIVVQHSQNTTVMTEETIVQTFE